MSIFNKLFKRKKEKQVMDEKEQNTNVETERKQVGNATNEQSNTDVGNANPSNAQAQTANTQEAVAGNETGFDDDNVAIKVEDLVTKDMLEPLLARLKSTEDENKGLKEQNEKLVTENENLKGKYENQDFGHTGGENNGTVASPKQRALSWAEIAKEKFNP